MLLCLLLAIAGVVPLSAGGQKESPVAHAKAMIAQKDYAGALKLLAAIQRDNPELRDQVQTLIDEVYAIKDRYNIIIAQLSKAQEAEDDDAMQKLMAEAQELDPQASAGIGRGIGVRVAFLKLMNDAADLLAAGKPVDALAKYLLPLKDPAAAGVDLQKPEFNAAGYGTLVSASVADSASRILASADRELAAVDAATGVPAAVGSLLGAALSAGSLPAFDAATSPLLRASTDEGRVRGAAASLADLNRTLAGTGGRVKPDPYLEYLVWLARGREDKTEGIAEAIDRIWAGLARAVLTTAQARATSSYAGAVSRFQAGASVEADTAFADAYYAGVIAVKAAALAGSSLKTSASVGWALAAAHKDEAKRILGDAAAAQAHASESAGYRTLIAQRAAIDALPSPQSLPADRFSEVRASLSSAMDAMTASAAQWTARAGTLRFRMSSGLVPADAPDSTTRVAEAFSSYLEELHQRDSAYGVQLATLESSGFATVLANAVAMRRKAQDLVNATVDGVPTPGAPRKPSDAIALYTSAADTLAGLRRDLDAFRVRWQADEQPWVVGSPGLSALLKSNEELAAQAGKESAETSRLSDLALTQHANAVGKRKEADSVFSAANKAFTQKSYDNARANFIAARDLYAEALVFEDDPVALKVYSTDIPTALKKIDDTTRAQKLADVDALFAAGRKQFNNGEFLKAFNTLQDALSGWRILQGDEPYPALEDLITQVRGALEASGGRDLEPTDSRADTVNAFFSNASAKVSQADTLAKSSPERVHLLNEALENVQYALELVPVYRGAKALQLRIKKDLAPNDAQFGDQADKEIGEILAAYNAGSTNASTAYFQLKDYYVFRPKYPGLTDLLSRLEVSLGFKSAPISSANISESDSQYRNAADLYRLGTEDSFRSALKNLNQAIALNPGNSRALELRRTILLKLGSPEVSVLSAADLTRFNDAKRLITNNDYPGAYQVLDQLMTKDGGRNKTYAPLASAWLLARQTLGL